MADFIFNVAKGRLAYYCGLPGTADALVVVPIEATGIVADSTMKDIDDLATLLAGASNEQVTMGRKTIASGVTVATDDTNDRTAVSLPNQTWAAATGNNVGKLVVCYDADTGSGTDSALIPLFAVDWVVSPSGIDETVQWADPIVTAS